MRLQVKTPRCTAFLPRIHGTLPMVRAAANEILHLYKEGKVRQHDVRHAFHTRMHAEVVVAVEHFPPSQQEKAGQDVV